MFKLIEEAVMRFRAGLTGEDGQAVAQFGLLIGLVATVSLVSLTAVGLAVSGNLHEFASAIGGASPSLRLS